MAGTWFIWALAALTAACGIALIVMLWRRRTEQAATAEIVERAERKDPDNSFRLIDDYAIPIELPAKGSKPQTSETQTSDAHTSESSDAGLSKICPACGSRYGHQYRTCSRDHSELAALN